MFVFIGRNLNLNVELHDCLQDEEVSEFAVDAFKDVPSKARQRKERQEEEVV